MKKTILFLSVATLLSASSAFAASTTPVSCEDMAKQVDTALKGNKLSPADLKIVNQHDKAGQDLCKAQKTSAANTEFDAALKLLKKS